MGSINDLNEQIPPQPLARSSSRPTSSTLTTKAYTSSEGCHAFQDSHGSFPHSGTYIIESSSKQPSGSHEPLNPDSGLLRVIAGAQEAYSANWGSPLPLTRHSKTNADLRSGFQGPSSHTPKAETRNPEDVRWTWTNTWNEHEQRRVSYREHITIQRPRIPSRQWTQHNCAKNDRQFLHHGAYRQWQ